MTNLPKAVEDWIKKKYPKSLSLQLKAESALENALTDPDSPIRIAIEAAEDYLEHPKAQVDPQDHRHSIAMWRKELYKKREKLLKALRDLEPEVSDDKQD